MHSCERLLHEVTSPRVLQCALSTTLPHTLVLPAPPRAVPAGARPRGCTGTGPGAQSRCQDSREGREPTPHPTRFLRPVLPPLGILMSFCDALMGVYDESDISWRSEECFRHIRVLGGCVRYWLWRMRCFFPRSTSSSFLCIDTGQKGLRCDAMGWMISGSSMPSAPCRGDFGRAAPSCAMPNAGFAFAGSCPA